VNALRIDVVDRYAALELSRRLAGFRTYVVQCGRDRWFVAVEADGDGRARSGDRELHQYRWG
jgi:hypothetical protein